MAKKINSVYFDNANNCIVIQEDNVQKGDYIDIEQLSSLQQYIEKTYKQQFINNFKHDEEYKKLVNENEDLKSQTKHFEDKIKIAQNDAVNEFRKSSEYQDLKSNLEKIQKENYDLKHQNKEWENKLDQAKKDAVSDYKNGKEYTELLDRLKQREIDYQTLNNDIINREKTAILKFKSSDEYKQLNDMIKDLEHQKEILVFKHSDEIKELERNYNNEIDKFKNRQLSLNIKQHGEELEQWCDAQYKDNADSWKNAIWKRATKAINGTKPDYLFSVYSQDPSDYFEDEKWLKDHLCSSAVFEMKTELENSVNRTKNEDHISKLVKDCKNHNCQIGILVSELEKEQNFVFRPYPQTIDGVSLYIIRPEGFITMLKILYHCFNLHKSEVLQNLTFKDKKEIIAEFEEFKKGLIDSTLKNIEKNLQKIKYSANKIQKEADSILQACKTVTDTHLSTLENKIQKFQIQKKIDKIDRIESPHNQELLLEEMKKNA